MATIVYTAASGSVVQERDAGVCAERYTVLRADGAYVGGSERLDVARRIADTGREGSEFLAGGGRTIYSLEEMRRYVAACQRRAKALREQCRELGQGQDRSLLRREIVDADNRANDAAGALEDWEAAEAG